MNAVFFPTQAEFRDWLSLHHQSETELIVGYCKVGSGRPSMTWSESVDQALCFGWIDGVRRSIDAETYCIRFTPRKRTSIWSAVNIRKVEALTRAGLMMPAGLTIFAARREDYTEGYTYQKPSAELSPKYENQFRFNPLAWEFFCAQAPSYQRATLHWIMGAKQEQTRLSRLEKTIQASAEQRRVL